VPISDDLARDQLCLAIGSHRGREYEQRCCENAYVCATSDIAYWTSESLISTKKVHLGRVLRLSYLRVNHASLVDGGCC
jgi:hypothetical protein